MEELCYVALSCLLAIVLLYGVLELHYFMRMCLCVLLARFVKRRCHILEATTVNGMWQTLHSNRGVAPPPLTIPSLHRREVSNFSYTFKIFELGTTGIFKGGWTDGLIYTNYGWIKN